MSINLFFLIIFCFPNSSIGTTNHCAFKQLSIYESPCIDSTCNSYLPVELKNFADTEIELLTPLTIYDLQKTLDTLNPEDKRIRYDYFNIVRCREINEGIITAVQKEDNHASFVYKSDIEQGLTTRARFILRCMLSENYASCSFFIYDTLTKTKYKSTESISNLLKAIKYNQTHEPQLYVLEKMSKQDYLDKHIQNIFEQ